MKTSDANSSISRPPPTPLSTSTPERLTDREDAAVPPDTPTDESDPGPVLRLRRKGQRSGLARSQPLAVEPRAENDLPGSAKISLDSRHALRNLSRSTPTMNRLDSQAAFEVTRSQRKFLRRFKGLNAREQIIKSFSCALVSDILLQGRLYITSEHFAFYSNLFGHITRILIPCSLVVRVTKEKTARIIPNAIAVESSEGRHVFGSLLSRDSAYETMVRVWKKATGIEEPSEVASVEEGLDDDEPELLAPPGLLNDLSDSTATDEVDSTLDYTGSLNATPTREPPSGGTGKLELLPVRSVPPPSTTGAVLLLLSSAASGVLSHLAGGRIPQRSTALLLLCNVLLVLIFCSSYASLTRMEEIQRGIQLPYQRVEEPFPDSLEEAERTLNLHLKQLAVVRKSLETLSSLAGVSPGEPH